MSAIVVVGGFFGDEGKGKIISYLALNDKPSIVVRGGVGPNAGHTVVYKGKTYKLRQIPSGFVYEKARLLIGPGVLINPEVLLREIKETGIDPKRLGVDYQCGIIEKTHIERDRKPDLKGRIGTTGTGCGPANADRALRVLKVARDVPELKKFLTDVPGELHEAIDNGLPILVEGTQGTFLSLYHGTYPFVTSDDVTASGICADVGIGPKHVKDVIIVFKSYVTRVGAGPLPGELSEEEAARRGWLEIATVTGRKRRAAPFNFDLAKRAVKLNSATMIAITKLDVVFPETAGVSDFDKLSDRAIHFIREVEKKLHVPVKIISTGPDIEHTIDLR
ncbi:MAG: adenylosuccinate synthetase [Candidatus Njordarchaeales archaeon]